MCVRTMESVSQINIGSTVFVSIVYRVRCHQKQASGRQDLVSQRSKTPMMMMINKPSEDAV